MEPQIGDTLVVEEDGQEFKAEIAGISSYLVQWKDGGITRTKDVSRERIIGHAVPGHAIQWAAKAKPPALKNISVKFTTGTSGTPTAPMEQKCFIGWEEGGVVYEKEIPKETTAPPTGLGTDAAAQEAKEKDKTFDFDDTKWRTTKPQIGDKFLLNGIGMTGEISSSLCRHDGSGECFVKWKDPLTGKIEQTKFESRNITAFYHPEHGILHRQDTYSYD